MKINRLFYSLSNFVRQESFAGILLMLASLIALIFANSPLDKSFDALLSYSISVGFGEYRLSKTVLHWVNDGLMAIFFLLIGLELKREMRVGYLSKLNQIILPGLAAIGGVIVPVLIYVYFNHQHPLNMRGWAIPAATDIAFALGILSLLGKRIPISLKIFLLALAIYDDIFAIIIIAMFYTSQLSMLSLGLACLCIVLLILLNRCNVKKLLPYLAVGLLLWMCVLKSGVHATLAGVVLAFCIPLDTTNEKTSPLNKLEHSLHPWVMFFILPAFALANVGVDLRNMTLQVLTDPLFLGVSLGLFIGKQVGIFSFATLVVKCKLAKLPHHASFTQLYGVSILGGIGFTMSLFISGLAFDLNEASRLGIILGSLCSAVLGFVVLSRV